jgi:xylulose-5-phosphate/fructose-6-phosphate phosphoketolase
MNRPLSGAAPSAEDLRLMDAWWRAANYLSVGQIYLLDNPLLERPIERADLKPRCSAISARRLASISSTCISTG